jgi:hypothetical protein
VQRDQVRDPAPGERPGEVQDVRAVRPAEYAVLVLDEHDVDTCGGEVVGGGFVRGDPVLTDDGDHLVAVTEPVTVDCHDNRVDVPGGA